MPGQPFLRQPMCGAFARSTEPHASVAPRNLVDDDFGPLFSTEILNSFASPPIFRKTFEPKVLQIGCFQLSFEHCPDRARLHITPRTRKRANPHLEANSHHS
jgi:hypothetical protein